MTTRDELAALICEHTNVEHADRYLLDAILARWRLVPVEEACRCIAGNEHYKSDHAAQHRAADELTQHDQTAGHYADQAEERFVNANEDDAPPSYESVYGFRTDQHGPHED